MNILKLNNPYIYKLLIEIRHLLFATTYTFDALTKNESGICVLCYHDFSNSKWEYSTSVNMFKKQVTYLLRKGYKFYSTSSLEQHLQNKITLPKKSIILTIDDGYESVKKVLPFLKLKKIPVTLFVLSDPKNINRSEVDNNHSLLNITDIKRIINEDVIIGCHSTTHNNLTTISDLKVLEKNIIFSKNVLEKTYGKRANYFAYPKGFLNKKVLSAVKKAKFKLAFCTEIDALSKNTSLLKIPRIVVDKSYNEKDLHYLLSPSTIKLRKFIYTEIL